MNDPHVEWLAYSAAPAREGVYYKDPAPVKLENDIGRFELSDGVLKVWPSDHYADIQSARDAVEGYLKAWELRADLEGNPGVIRFAYDDAKVVDRDPPPPGSPHVVIAAGSCVMNVATAAAKVTIGKAAYPEPPTDFEVTAEVETAHMRWLRYKDGKDSLQSTAYFILTLLEGAAGGRKAAASRYGIPFATLKRIGGLSSTRGDAETARKAPLTDYVELTGEEKSWLERTVREVIIQLGRHGC